MKFLLLFLLTIPAFAKSVNIQLPAEPNTLDPYQVSDVFGFGIISNVVEGLVRHDGKGKLENGLAASYKVSKDHKTYEFTLKDSKWSDGVKVKAEDFVVGLRHALHPKTAARDAELLFAIKGARDYYAAKSEFLGVSTKDGKLIIELENPDSSFLEVLTMPLASPLRPEHKEWNYRNPVTGRYRITTYKMDRKIDLEPNPSNQMPGQLPITYKVIPEETTALNLLETGTLDIISTIPNTEIKRLGSMAKILPGAATTFLVFDISRPPFNNILWRKAIAASIDRESIAALLQGPYSASTSYLPAAIEGFKEFENKDFSQTKKIVDSEKPEVKITFAASVNANLILQKIQNDLLKNLGLQAALEPMEWKAFLGKLKSNVNQAFVMSWSAPFNDPLSHLKPFLSNQVDNHSHYANPAYDALLKKILATPAGKARTKLVEEAHALLVNKDVVLVPLLERKQLFGVRKNIEGFEVSPFTVIQLHQLRKRIP